MKRPPPGQQLVEDDAEAEDVGAAIDAVPFAAGLLGTHVGGRAGVARPVAHVLLAQGQAEIGDERPAGGVEQDVARLDVAVDEALRWWACCSASATVATSAAGCRAGRPCADRPARVRPSMNFDTMKQGKSVGAAHVEDGDDVRVVEAGDGAGLGEVGVGVRGLAIRCGVRHLDRHQALELLVAGQVDAAEAALAQEPLDAVAADVPGKTDSGATESGIWERSGMPASPTASACGPSSNGCQARKSSIARWTPALSSGQSRHSSATGMSWPRWRSSSQRASTSRMRSSGGSEDGFMAYRRQGIPSACDRGWLSGAAVLSASAFGPWPAGHRERKQLRFAPTLHTKADQRPRVPPRAGLPPGGGTRSRLPTGWVRTWSRKDRRPRASRYLVRPTEDRLPAAASRPVR